MSPPQSAGASRRRSESADSLVLSELNPHAVIDHLADANQPSDIMTFGTVREICPKCQSGHLKLVLRQSSIRVAHLFCADCASCFDAHYTNGEHALTI
jgi:hypothetical protein